MADTRIFLSVNLSWLVDFTYREANSVADSTLVKLALTFSEEKLWIEGPTQIFNSVVKEKYCNE